MSEPDAQRTVLALLNAAGEALPVGALLRATEILGLEEGAVRMALTRLKSRGVVDNPRRGRWQLGQGALPERGQIMGWRRLTDRLIAWDGVSFIGLLEPTGPRPPQTLERAHERALATHGLRAWRSGLAVRPHNLIGGVRGLEDALSKSGALKGSRCVVLHDAGRGELKGELAALWDIAAIEAGYADALARMEAATASTRNLPIAQAAREAFLTGEFAISTLSLDPLLPAPMIDVDLRARCVATLRDFHDAGQHLWRQVLHEKT